VHFDCAGSHEAGAAAGAYGIFTQISAQMALRLRRRARNMAAAGVFGVFPVNFHTKWLLRNVHVRVGCASSHKTRHLIQKSCQETSYRELVQRSCQETSYGDLVQRSVQLTEIFPTELL